MTARYTPEIYARALWKSPSLCNAVQLGCELLWAANMEAGEIVNSQRPRIVPAEPTGYLRIHDDATRR
jgi:hypothetical protein